MADELHSMDLLANPHDTSSAMPKAQRRSACDDCRARKVQCSGDLAGCFRCRRAGTRCTYSAPKPPGRPRKVRKVTEDQKTNDELLQPSQLPPTLFGELYSGGGEFNTGSHGLFGINTEFFDPSFLQASTFSLPSFNATSVPPATPKSFSSISSPPLFPWSPPDEAPPTPISTSTSLITTIQPCSCLPAFFNSLNALRMPPPISGSFSLPNALTTLRTTRTTITTSTRCQYCHTSVQSTYVCMMMLGTLLPLLLLYIENALTAISSTSASTVTLNLGGVDVDLGKDAWIEMAKSAVKKEFDAVMTLVDQIEGILEKRHCEGRGKETEGLEVIARGGVREPGVGEVVGRELTNRSHETGEPPFCLGLLWMIRKMGQRISVGAGVWY